MIFTLDMLPPSVNHMYRSTGGAHKALSKEAATFRKVAVLTMQNAAALAGYVVPDGELCAIITLMFKTRRRCDIDNRVKALLDAAGMALCFDDSRVWDLRVRRVQGGAERTTIEIVRYQP